MDFRAALLGLTALWASGAELKPIDDGFGDPDPFWEEPTEFDTSLRWLPPTPLFEDGGPREICVGDL